MWKPGYITHGLLDHSIDQVIDLLSATGYSALGITLGPAHLDHRQVSVTDLQELRHKLDAKGLAPSIETEERLLQLISLVDMLELPAELPAGEYGDHPHRIPRSPRARVAVLGFRWDCEQTPQIWNACANVEITCENCV